ncbi:MAG: VOC family protein [Myxococcota bacterium]
MIDHLVLRTANFHAMRQFYDKVLGALGYLRIEDFRTPAGQHMSAFGLSEVPGFWLSEGDSPSGMHLAFAAPSEHAVRSFHALGLSEGGQDNGEPMLRPHYHAAYFAAYLLDPDGNNVEAVHHGDQAS